MNRIVLIGNGFDLAHGLKTSYHDFLDDYWQKCYDRLRECKDCQLSDEFYHFEIRNGDEIAGHVEIGYLLYLLIMYINTNMTWAQMIANEEWEIKSFKDLTQLCTLLNEYQEKIENSPYRIRHGFISQLFAEIHSYYNNKWMDIENEYYQLLSKTYYGKDSEYETAEDLNEELNIIKSLLVNYLSKIQDEKIIDNLFNKDIAHKILAPFDLRDISNGGQEMFLDYLFFMVSELPGGMSAGEIEEVMKNHPEYQIGNTKEETYREMIYDMLGKGELDDYIFPNRTLLLNFNYTNTAEKLYLQSAANNFECELINIHGELNNLDNPIIFGYGDEMDEHYKKIVDLNNNDYLQNIKSIRYLETDNYRNLLSFIDSAPYQIYIMGHSCGNSDRTLLNTIFEHKNCISIKPYYYEKKDGGDNYIEIVQNIYRNFKDMALMRDKVVNKCYCEPMPQNKPH